MKLVKLLFKYITCLVLLLTVTSIKITRNHYSAKAEAYKYLNFARLPYCIDSNQSYSCRVCDEIQNKGYKIQHVESQIKNRILFNMVVSSNSYNEMVVSFGGPKSQNVGYMQQIYANGMRYLPELNNALIENEFWSVYSSFFRNSLMGILKESQPEKVVFVGHSFGGSLAIISAYDMVYNNIIENYNIQVFTFGALKIGSQGLIQTIQRTIQAPIIRIKRNVDFFTMMPRCIYVQHFRVWHCYRNYVNLVRTFPMLAHYYMRFSPIIRRELVGGLPYIVKHEERYINRPVIVQNSHYVTQHEMPKQTNNFEHSESHHSQMRDHEKSGKLQQLANIPEHHKIANNHEDHSISHHTQTEHDQNKSHTHLNGVLPESKEKGMDHETIKKVSELFNHNDSDKDLLPDEEDKLKYADHTPIKYSIKHASKSHDSAHQSNVVTKERLASHVPLMNNKGINYLNSNNASQNSLNGNAHLTSQHTSHKKLDDEEEKLRLSSHTPQTYSGPNSQSIFSQLSIYPYKGQTFLEKTQQNIQSSSSNSVFNSHNLPSLFLETDLKVEHYDYLDSNSLFRNCDAHGNYFSCRFMPELHQVFFGVNIESC